MKFDNKAPIYIQIMDKIKIDIINGTLKPGDKLPSVREMAVKFKVNPNTLQRVYQELERENITYTQRGTGSFVREDSDMIINLKKEMASEVIENFIENIKEFGFGNKDILKIVEDKLNEEEK
ncbi:MULTISPECIES: GntR family transcriptional regulator [Clostridium]|uniref:Transcriptional regulator, GntR family n=1 Tax=Clostridium acetobutylicum (strain ATCC 824 / DSM 792 / JCM 1419 / IAM 19013 / LMG 5710 / NBRC 13948 / NRRL B-527 / VKM B-1787 / 2291 / W) TaxID=272562 RepID=Q97MD3_CLOAB|nr:MULTISPECIES: GntR family transcriptional regulator [Clostridium]AAK78246.1 Transcriptional regulator, GntR family [Clostridium acetobutylicum ATCC 824]ADZ19312.1 Transcriptional regulator, GntR family [Clostridium acetobutylicum EA 2018]AEI31138.1 GntR family transcriptional regulator [Clostridium acetobutylicum DSM 1731]AWV82053.1 GntR family transcriptional regulator [Clostridium acetobutylicum]KHD34688.1 GntR family transcriptional regulator [Clostridium acetobutylicum]